MGNQELLAFKMALEEWHHRLEGPRTLTWDIESVVRRAQLRGPDPGGGPLNRLFVPVGVCSHVLHWAHTYTTLPVTQVLAMP